MRSRSDMPKQQPNGTPGKKPPAPSVKVRRPTAFDTLVEILNRRSRKTDDDAEPAYSTPRKMRRQVTSRGVAGGRRRAT
jgi:hypothetical protein